MPRVFARLLLTVAAVACAGAAMSAEPIVWDDVAARARGQTVYFNAWGGSERINDYIAWVAGRVAVAHDIRLEHVKLADTADAVARVLAEKTAGRTSGGSVDLIWINGENFAAMKAQSLLFGPFAEQLPNDRFVDTVGKPTTRVDFTVPVDGLEVPWGMAQIVFLYDTARVRAPPRHMAALLAWAEAHPGRFTYPAPPDFTGSTFLKQALYGLAPDVAMLQQSATDAGFAAATAPLWSWLDRLHPLLWRGGATFPGNDQAQRQLLDDGEIDISLSFNPGEASSAIAQGLLPAQMVAAHNAGLDLLRRAMAESQTARVVEESTRQYARLSEVFLKQLDRFQRQRGRQRQTIRIEHVRVVEDGKVTVRQEEERVR